MHFHGPLPLMICIYVGGKKHLSVTSAGEELMSASCDINMRKVAEAHAWDTEAGCPWGSVASQKAELVSYRFSEKPCLEKEGSGLSS